MGRHILHIDINAMYSSCHQAVEPDKYAGRAVAVAGDPKKRRGIILTASYEARKYGVKTAMTVWQALNLCPQLILIPPDYELYREYNRRILELFYCYTPLVEPFSIDEAWLDVGGSLSLFGNPRKIAETIQGKMKEEVGLPCSIGIGDSKLLSKMASGMRKPLGITELYQRDVPGMLWPLPVGQLFGVGKKLRQRMELLGIRTIGDLAHFDRELLQDNFGVVGLRLWEGARGVDSSPVDPNSVAIVKSIGNSVTLPKDLVSLEQIRPVLFALADRVGRRVRKRKMVGTIISLTIRYQDRATVHRSYKLRVGTDLTQTIYETGIGLFRQHRIEGMPVRLLGLTLSGLLPLEPDTYQLNLFEEEKNDQRQRLNQMVDKIRDKFGETAVVWGRMLEK